METPITVLIVDDHPATREGLRALVDEIFTVVGEAGNGAEAVYLVGERHPQVVLLSSRLPEVDGLAATRAIKSCRPQTRVIVLALHAHECAAAWAAGADACLLKGCSREELIAAIHKLGSL